MPTYQKMQAAVTGPRSMSALLRSLKNAWEVASIGLLMKPVGSAGPSNFAEGASVPELQSLIDMIRVVRRKILANTALRSWVTWVCWVLAGMILLAAISPKLAIYTAGAGVLAAIGTVLIFVWAWRTKPSAYDAACRLDSAAGLHDRASTALFFGAIANPEGIILLQRRDALARVSQVNSGHLFPIRAPALAVRAVILAVVVAGFFVYRMHYRPPLTALLQSTARSHLMQSLLAPLEHALAQNLQRNTVQADPKQDAQEDQKRISGSEQDSDALWATAADQNEAQTDAKKDAQEMDFSEQGEDEGQQGAQGGTQAGDSDTEAEQQSQEGNNGSDSASNDSQNSEGQNSQSGKSLAQSLMQALKNMMSGSSGQRMPSQGNQQRSSQGMPQSGSSDQSGKESDRQQNSQAGRSNSDQKATQNNGNGAGNQPGSKEMKPNPVLPVRAVPDRVALQSSTMKDQMRMRNGTETGTAHLAVRPLSPKAIAVINGREQENIPARYRLYVQHYFEHADNGPR